jgi:hypothetical protein
MIKSLYGGGVSAAEERGWTVLIDQTGGDRGREQLAISGIRSGLIDGLLFSPLALTVDDLANRTDKAPTIVLRERIGVGPADHGGIDNAGAREARRAPRQTIKSIISESSAAPLSSRDRKCDLTPISIEIRSTLDTYDHNECCCALLK